jgi:Lar family restriction alleviation protein
MKERRIKSEFLVKNDNGILPCPFCGGNAHLLGDPHTDHLVVCERCGAQMFDTDATLAIESWNKRIYLES